jgi:hypothetical protein
MTNDDSHNLNKLNKLELAVARRPYMLISLMAGNSRSRTDNYLTRVLTGWGHLHLFHPLIASNPSDRVHGSELFFSVYRLYRL